MIKSIVAFIAGVLICAIFSTSLFFYLGHKKTIKIHKLEFPLLLTSESNKNSLSLLPKGTTLYFDNAYPEGFTRYKVYINVDRMPLELKELEDPTLIAPIEAYAPDKDELHKLLRNYPLTKNDLASILRSEKISNDEIKEVFKSYLNNR